MSAGDAILDSLRRLGLSQERGRILREREAAASRANKNSRLGSLGTIAGAGASFLIPGGQTGAFVPLGAAAGNIAAQQLFGDDAEINQQQIASLVVAGGQAVGQQNAIADEKQQNAELAALINPPAEPAILGGGEPVQQPIDRQAVIAKLAETGHTAQAVQLALQQPDAPVAVERVGDTRVTSQGGRVTKAEQVSPRTISAEQREAANSAFETLSVNDPAETGRALVGQLSKEHQEKVSASLVQAHDKSRRLLSRPVKPPDKATRSIFSDANLSARREVAAKVKARNDALSTEEPFTPEQEQVETDLAEIRELERIRAFEKRAGVADKIDAKVKALKTGLAVRQVPGLIQNADSKAEAVNAVMSIFPEADRATIQRAVNRSFKAPAPPPAKAAGKVIAPEERRGAQTERQVQTGVEQRQDQAREKLNTAMREAAGRDASDTKLLRIAVASLRRSQFLRVEDTNAMLAEFGVPFTVARKGKRIVTTRNAPETRAAAL